MDLLSLDRKVTDIANAVANPNLAYSASIDLGSAFPAVIQLGMSDEEIASLDEIFPDDDLLETLRFLAENGRLFPKSMKEASLDEFRAYLKENEEAIFSTIKEEAEKYYEEYTGDSYTPPCPPCPYCESTDTETTDEENRFHCCECGHLFDTDDIRREELRHTLSPRLSGTSEENPLEVNIPIGEHGVTVVDRLFLFEDGTIWFQVKGETEYRDIDTLSIADLETVTNL